MEYSVVEYCCQCSEYPCGIYEHMDDFDSFITHRNRKTDLEKVRQPGIEAYNREQRKKIQILDIRLSVCRLLIKCFSGMDHPFGTSI